MNLPSNSVVVLHPAKQYVYQVVLGLQRAGLLHRFVTGIYFKPRTFPYKLVRRLPHGPRRRIERELQKRYLKELENDRIISIPYFEGLSRLIARILPLMTKGRSTYLFANWASDLYASRWLARCHPKPSLVYCFLGSALRTFQVARQMGVLTVLEVPITLNAPAIVAQARRSLGMSVGYDQLELRLRQEVLAADDVIVLSPIVAESVIMQGVPPERITVLPLGVDVTEFRPKPQGGSQENGTFRALFVGKFMVRKGVQHLLEAWRQLALPKSELWVVGPPGDMAFVERMRVQYGGRFVEVGNVPHYEIAELYRQADVFVFPSLAEGFGMVSLEAMASGLPCVLTPQSGSMLRDGIDGFIVPEGDIEALKERILTLYQDEELRRRMGAAARQRAEEFTWERYQSKLVDIIYTIWNKSASHAKSHM